MSKIDEQLEIIETAITEIDRSILKLREDRKTLRDRTRTLKEEAGLVPIAGTRCKESSQIERGDGTFLNWRCQLGAYANGYCKKHDPNRPKAAPREPAERCNFKGCLRARDLESMFCSEHIHTWIREIKKGMQIMEQGVGNEQTSGDRDP